MGLQLAGEDTRLRPKLEAYLRGMSPAPPDLGRYTSYDVKGLWEAATTPSLLPNKRDNIPTVGAAQGVVNMWLLLLRTRFYDAVNYHVPRSTRYALTRRSTYQPVHFGEAGRLRLDA